MAPVLQCPDCHTKHPIANVPTSGAFPCQGCGRVLKVPEIVSQRLEASRPVPVATAVASPTGAAPAMTPGDRASTRLVSEVDEKALGALNPNGGRKPVARLGSVPWWMRLLLWIVAVPLSFLIVFLIARAFNVFTSNQLSDVFLANDKKRFWPVARLLPFVALFTAGLVQAGIYGLARLRGRGGSSSGPAPDLSRPVSRRSASAR